MVYHQNMIGTIKQITILLVCNDVKQVVEKFEECSTAYDIVMKIED